MRTKTILLLAVLFLVASPIFAQQPAAGGGAVDPFGLKPLAAVLGMAIASGLCGLAQGKAVAGAAEAIARNPGARGGIQLALILGLILIESLAIYTLVVVFSKT